MVKGILLGVLPHLPLGLLHLGGNIGGKFQDGLISRWGALLGQESDCDAPLQGDGSRVGGGFFENQREKRRFARSIGPDESHTVSAVNLQGGLFEEGSSAVRFGKTGSCQHNGMK